MTQQEAFLTQARSDFAVYKRLRKMDNLPACHYLHYLQMATEKLVKAARIEVQATGAEQQSHVAFSKLAAILRHSAPAASSLNITRTAFHIICDQIQPIMVEIERLAPAVGTSPNVEYPWQARNANGDFEWFAPSESEFSVEKMLRSPNGAALLKLIEVLLEDFERIIGR